LTGPLPQAASRTHARMAGTTWRNDMGSPQTIVSIS
jgi:hypothetical protein